MSGKLARKARPRERQETPAPDGEDAIELTPSGEREDYTSRLATDRAFSWMNSRRGSTMSPISFVNISSATSA